MIDKVKITGFKRLDDFELSVARPATVLLGGNNSGKSSVLEAIQLAVSAAQAVRMAGGSEWREDALRASIPQEYLSSARVDVRGAIRGGRQSASIRLTAEAMECVVTLTPRADAVEIVIEGQLLGEQISDLQSPFCVYVPGLAGIQLREPAWAEGAVIRAIARGDSNLVLRNVLYLLKRQTASWQAFLEDLRTLFADAEFEFRYAPEIDDTIKVWFRHGGGPLLPLENAGTGVLQCVQLLAYARLFEPQVLLLDEPDAHMHANNQRRLCSLVLKIAEEQATGRIVLATHSRHIVSALREDARLCWLKDGNLLPSDESNLVAALLELGALDDGEKLAGKTLKCLVLTEDEDQKIIEALLWSSGFVEQETLVLSYKGCTNKITVAALCQAFRERLPGVRIVVHRDRDYNDAQAIAKIAQEIREAAATPFITDDTDAEYYFLSGAFLAELGTPADRVQALIEKASAEAKLESLRKMINCRHQLALDRRKVGAPFPDVGKIAIACQVELEAAPMRLLHGKTGLSRVRTLLQEEHGINPNPFFRASPALRVEALARIAVELWPAPAKKDAVPREHEPKALESGESAASGRDREPEG